MDTKELINKKLIKLNIEELQKGYINNPTTFIQEIINNNDVEFVENQFDDLLYNTFSDWYYNVCLSHNDKINKCVSDFPDSINPIEADNKVLDFLTHLPAISLSYPISIKNEGANKYRYKIDTKIVQGNYYESKFECFIALNLKTIYIEPFIKEFFYRAPKHSMFPVIEFSNCDYRKDTIVIYSNYNDIMGIIDILYEIKDTMPYVLSAVDVPSSIFGVIDEFIGFGEVGSANIDEYYDRFTTTFQKNLDNATNIVLREFLYLENNPSNTITTNNKQLPIMEYLSELIKYELLLELKKNITLLNAIKNKNVDEVNFVNNLHKLSVMLNENKFSEKIDIQNKNVRKMFSTHIVEPAKTNLTNEDFEYDLNVKFNYLDNIFNILNEDTSNLKYSLEYKYRLVNSYLYETFKKDIVAISNNEHYTPYDVLRKLIKISVLKSIDELLKTNLNELDKVTILNIRKNIDEDSRDGKSYISDFVYEFQRELYDNENSTIKIKMLNKYEVTVNLNIKQMILYLFPELNGKIKDLVISSIVNANKTTDKEIEKS